MPMETYSLLQESLDQTIGLTALEEASDAVRSVARADCIRLLREKSGIFMSNMDRDEALAFQAALKAHHFSTSVVADRDLPVLHESFQIQRIDLKDEVLVLTDSMGRVRTRPLTDLVFLASGYINRIMCKTEWHQHLDFSRAEGRGGGMPRLVNEREYREENELEFRLDFFFWAEPNRLHAALASETAIFFQGRPVRLKTVDALNGLLSSMGNLLPPERLNSGLRVPESCGVYPGFQSYEKEIRWHFHRLKSLT